MRETIMRRPNPLLLFLSSVAVALLSFLAGCGGGGGDDESNGEIGQLTNPKDVPSASPWQQPPDVVILDPNAITPIAGSEPTATPVAGEPGVCGPKYTIASGDTFSSVAEKCGTSTQAIRDANPGVDPLTIHPGDVINIPAAEPEPSP